MKKNMFKKSLSVAALALCAVAFTSNASAAVYASELKAGTGSDTAAPVSFVLNTDATNVKLIIKDSSDTVVRTMDLGAKAKGVQSATWDLKKDDNTKAAAGQYKWEIEANGDTIDAARMISDDASELMQFYSPRGGVVVDNSFESPYFGRVYVSETMGGQSSAGGATRFLTAGIYVLDAALTDCTGQGATAYEGGVAWTKSADPFRMCVDEEGTVYITSWADSNSGIWTMDPANPSGNFESLLADGMSMGETGIWTNGASEEVIGSTSSVYVEGTGENRVIYAGNEDLACDGQVTDTYGAYLGILKWNIGTGKIGTKPEVVFQNASVLGNGNGTFGPDGQGAGGWWFSQYRSAETLGLPCFMHVVGTDNTTIDYNSGSADPNILNGGGNDRGSFAVTVDGKRIATLNTINNNYIVCDVDYSAGAPVVTSFAETPAAGSGRANCAFDAAGNLYTTSANDERLRVFELPTTENKFTTPAPSSQQLTVSAAGVENWEVM